MKLDVYSREEIVSMIVNGPDAADLQTELVQKRARWFQKMLIEGTSSEILSAKDELGTAYERLVKLEQERDYD